MSGSGSDTHEPPSRLPLDPEAARRAAPGEHAFLGPPSGLGRIARIVRPLVWVALGGLVAWYLHAHDFRPSIEAARRSDPWLLAIVAVFGNGALVWLKARRTHVLVRPLASIPTGRLTGYFLGSYAADNLIMSQAGVGVRVALLRREGVPLGAAIAVEGLQKVIEAMGLAPLALIALLAHLPPRVARPLHDGLWVALVIAVILVAFVITRPGSSPGSVDEPVPSRVLRHLRLWLKPIADAAGTMRRPLVALETIGLTLACWTVELAMVLLTLRAMDLPASIPVAALVVVAVNLAALVPGLPGNVGTFEAAGTLALSATGVGHASALAFTVLFHALHTIPVTLVGLPVLRRAGVRLRRADPASGR